MKREDRARAQKLEAALDRLDAAERRALVDLRAAGFTFTTPAEARAYREGLRRRNGFQPTPEQLDIALAALAAADRVTNIHERRAS